MIDCDWLLRNVNTLWRFLSYSIVVTYVKLHASLRSLTRVTTYQARQSLIVRGLFPMLADPRHPVSLVIFFFFGILPIPQMWVHLYITL